MCLVVGIECILFKFVGKFEVIVVCVFMINVIVMDLSVSFNVKVIIE